MGSKRVHWTTEEDMELRRIYALSKAGQSSKGLAQLAQRKRCSKENCRKRAEILGIQRVAGAHRRWTALEIENLKQYAGRITTRKIARILGRSQEAVNVQLSRLEVSGRVKERGYTRVELGDLMGIDLDTLRAFLKRFPMPVNLLGNFAGSEVQLWIWDHLEDLELRKMNQAWLKSMLRKVA